MMASESYDAFLALTEVASNVRRDKIALMPVGRASCSIYKAPVALNPACPDLSGIYRGGATCVKVVGISRMP